MSSIFHNFPLAAKVLVSISSRCSRSLPSLVRLLRSLLLCLFLRSSSPLPSLSLSLFLLCGSISEQPRFAMVLPSRPLSACMPGHLGKSWFPKGGKGWSISRPCDRAESIHRPLFFARELARYCPLKFLRDENKSFPDTNGARKWNDSPYWRDDNSCRYHENVGIFSVTERPRAITTPTEFVSFDACFHANGATFARQWRKRNELFLWNGVDGYSGELGNVTSYQSSNDIISLIKVSQGVSGIGANVQPDITFLRGYMKRYLFRRMIEKGYAVLWNVDVPEKLMTSKHDLYKIFLKYKKRCILYVY